jgi:hypothetical protein
MRGIARIFAHPDFRSWLQGDIQPPENDVCSTPKSGLLAGLGRRCVAISGRVTPRVPAEARSGCGESRAGLGESFQQGRSAPGIWRRRILCYLSPA